MRLVKLAALLLITGFLYYIILNSQNKTILILLSILSAVTVIILNFKSAQFFLAFSLLFCINYYVSKNLFNIMDIDYIIYFKFIPLMSLGYLSFLFIKKDNFIVEIYNKILRRNLLLNALGNSIKVVRRSIELKKIANPVKINFIESFSAFFYTSLKNFIKYTH